MNRGKPRNDRKTVRIRNQPVRAIPNPIATRIKRHSKPGSPDSGRGRGRPSSIGKRCEIAALAPSAIWVQMSTIGVAGIERVAAMVDAERPDVTVLDAPVSGSKVPAE